MAEAERTALQARIAALEAENARLREVIARESVPKRTTLRDKLRPLISRFQHYPPRTLNFPASYAATRLPADPPSIAIVTPSFNQAAYLGATIESVLGQGYPRLAYHVQDGGSTDTSVKLLEGYGDHLTWESARDNGQAHAINLGFARISGDVMAYLNSDDTLAPGTLAFVARAFADDPGLDFVYGHRICIDADGREIGRWVLPPHDTRAIRHFDFIPQETMFWRARAWQRLGGFDVSFQFAMDWDFILRAHAAGMRFKRLPRFLACFRVHDLQKTTAMAARGTEESQRLRTAHLGRVPDSTEITRASRAYRRRHVLFHRLYKLGLFSY